MILDMVRKGSSVLDLGCGEGELLALLSKYKKAKGQGIEADEQAIYKCVAKGLSVSHGDIDGGLSDYGDQSFDYVILNQSLQQVKKPDWVLKESLRVGKQVIVGFPNFAHFRVRFQILFAGRTPVTSSMPYEWFNTPNLHFLSISDFVRYCRNRSIAIKHSAFIGKKVIVRILPNLFGEEGIFLISALKKSSEGDYL